GVPDQHERALLAGAEQQTMQVPRRSLGGVGWSFRIAPEDPGPAVSAGASELRDPIVHPVKAEGPSHVATGFEHNDGRSAATAVDLHPATANVDELAFRRIHCRNTRASPLLVNPTRQQGHDSTRYDGTCDTNDPFHPVNPSLRLSRRAARLPHSARFSGLGAGAG